MAKIPIQIGAQNFATKTDAKSHARAIMARHAEAETIGGADDLFLRDLVAIHPEAARKIGSGISHFTTKLDPVWRKNRHFVIVRTDGTDTDVSFHICIDGSNDRRDVFHALRHAVAEQVISFQRVAFAGDILPICPYATKPKRIHGGIFTRFPRVFALSAASPIFPMPSVNNEAPPE